MNIWLWDFLVFFSFIRKLLNLFPCCCFLLLSIKCQQNCIVFFHSKNLFGGIYSRWAYMISHNKNDALLPIGSFFGLSFFAFDNFLDGSIKWFKRLLFMANHCSMAHLICNDALFHWSLATFWDFMLKTPRFLSSFNS